MLPVKICGITRLDDALLAADLGASALGFVFYPKSPRCVDADTVRLIGEHMPPAVARVGVFVNPDPESLLFTARLAQLTHVQLCGEEEPGLCEESPLPVIKVLRSASDYPTNVLANFPAAAFLVDGGRPGAYGGTGERSDWNFCRQLRDLKMTVLAGGVSAENVAAAVAVAQPDALDVSSALESEYGVKDHEKMRAFFAVIRALPEAHSRMRGGFI
ncbi:MAG: phosphoribosylanthranilate isomerase [bacterium]